MMPTAVPISFANGQQRHASGDNGHSGPVTSYVDNTNPVMQLSPSNLASMPAWRGSPMSYSILARSLGTKASFGLSPAPFSAAFSELNDFRVNGVPSSIESEAGKILRRLHGEDSVSRDLMQNYSCCGIDLPDLHALLEHFEEIHVVVLDDSIRPPSTSNVPTASSNLASSAAMMMMDEEMTDEPQSAFDPDAMDMDLDSGPSSSSSGSSPPSTPPVDTTGLASTTTGPTTSTNPLDPLVLRNSSRALSKAATQGSLSGYSTPRGMSPHPHHPPSTPGVVERTEASLFNPYASYSDFSALMPGTVRTPVHHQSPPSGSVAPTAAGPNGVTSIPPALLFSPSPSVAKPPSGSSTPSVSRNGSVSGVSGSKKSSLPQPSSPSTSTPGASSSSQNPLAAPTHKPFRCPTHGCNKSYKQANGLKYHITHGQCNFMPRDPALEGLNESEADEKSRPYVCQVGSCTRRYKNMNGLRYHYQHSGEHGAVGLALLASGQHSLQTGLKDAGFEIPPQVREQSVQAAQALARAKTEGGMSAPGTPTSKSGSSSPVLAQGQATPLPPQTTFVQHHAQHSQTPTPSQLAQLANQQQQHHDANAVAMAALGGVRVPVVRTPPVPMSAGPRQGYFTVQH